MLPDDRWMADAACKDMGPTVFFPLRGEPHAEAKAVCRGCPVRQECLAYGMGERHGVFGGLSERQRRNIRRDQYSANGRVIACVICGHDFNAPLNGPAAKYCSSACQRAGAIVRQREYNARIRRLAG